MLIIQPFQSESFWRTVRCKEFLFALQLERARCVQRQDYCRFPRRKLCRWAQTPSLIGKLPIHAKKSLLTLGKTKEAGSFVCWKFTNTSLVWESTWSHFAEYLGSCWSTLLFLFFIHPKKIFFLACLTTRPFAKTGASTIHKKSHFRISSVSRVATQRDPPKELPGHRLNEFQSKKKNICPLQVKSSETYHFWLPLFKFSFFMDTVYIYFLKFPCWSDQR
jgi:hypothetical protein